MAVITKQVAGKPAQAKVVQHQGNKPVARVANAKLQPQHTSNGFTILKGIEIPPKKSFGGKRGVYNELFAALEPGDCVEIPVEQTKTPNSKMNSLYNAARRNMSDITIRIHESAGEDGKGGTLRLWYNGQKETVEA